MVTWFVLMFAPLQVGAAVGRGPAPAPLRPVPRPGGRPLPRPRPRPRAGGQVGDGDDGEDPGVTHAVTADHRGLRLEAQHAHLHTLARVLTF